MLQKSARGEKSSYEEALKSDTWGSKWSIKAAGDGGFGSSAGRAGASAGSSGRGGGRVGRGGRRPLVRIKGKTKRFTEEQRVARSTFVQEVAISTLLDPLEALADSGPLSRMLGKPSPTGPDRLRDWARAHEAQTQGAGKGRASDAVSDDGDGGGGGDDAGGAAETE